MTGIADKIYAATGLTLGAEEAAAIGRMIQQARRDALKEAARREMPPEFLDWMKRQMPKDTIIGLPEWWAGRIWRAAIHAMKKGEGDE
jgi:hypothetical protein